MMHPQRTKTKTSHHDVRRCEGERLDTTGIGDEWWRCWSPNFFLFRKGVVKVEVCLF